jgi:hypothetical protein
MALVCKQTIPTKQMPPVGEVSAKFCGLRESCGQHSRSPRDSQLFRLEPLLLLPRSSSVVLTSMSGPRSRSTTSQKSISSERTFSILYACWWTPSVVISWLQIQRSQVRFPALPDFQSSGSGMECTQPHEYNYGATWKKK